jgi:hypothetical protein
VRWKCKTTPGKLSRSTPKAPPHLPEPLPGASPIPKRSPKASSLSGRTRKCSGPSATSRNPFITPLAKISSSWFREHTGSATQGARGGQGTSPRPSPVPSAATLPPQWSAE